MGDIIEAIAKAIWQNHRVEDADPPSVTWDEYVSGQHRESYFSAARAALSALGDAGYAVVEIPAALTPEEIDSIVGITDLMRGAASRRPPQA